MLAQSVNQDIVFQKFKTVVTQVLVSVKAAMETQKFVYNVNQIPL